MSPPEGVPHRPDVQLDGTALADLELALLGVLPQGHLLGGGVTAPTEVRAVRPNSPGEPAHVTLAVTPAQAEAARAADGVVLRDEEMTPLAELTLDAGDLADATAATDGAPVLRGALTRRRHREGGEGAQLALTEADLDGSSAGPLSLLVLGRPAVDADAAELAALRGRPGPLLVVVPAVTGASLPTGMLLRAAADLTGGDGAAAGATVRAAPLAWRDPASDTAAVARLAAALRADATLFLRADGADPASAAWREVRRQLEQGAEGAVPGVDPRTEALLRRWRPARARRGVVAMFTGFSGSGKSTLARDVSAYVLARTGRTLTLLDGDVVRTMLSSGLGFDRASRILNVRRIGYVGAEVARHGGMALCAPIAPYASTRADVRAMVEQVGDFVLVHVSTPLEECERRDLKGLYAKARAGLIPEFTGISDPYDVPLDADLSVDTSTMTRDAARDLVVDYLVRGGWLAPDPPDRAPGGDPLSLTDPPQPPPPASKERP